MFFTVINERSMILQKPVGISDDTMEADDLLEARDYSNRGESALVESKALQYWFYKHMIYWPIHHKKIFFSTKHGVYTQV